MPTIYDGDFTLANATQNPQFSFPIPRTNIPYSFTQTYMQLASSWSGLALNTPHATLTDYLLVAESEPVPLGGGVVKWTRTYAKIPPTYSDFEYFSYQFPGVIDIGIIGGTSHTPRQPQTRAAMSRIQYDFYKIDPTLGADDPTHNTYRSAGSIPILTSFRVVVQGTYLGANVGAVWVPAQYVSNGATIGGLFYLQTVPNTTAYEGMVFDAYKNGWNATPTQQVIKTDPGTDSAWIAPTTDSTNPSVYGGQIVVEESVPSPWMGNLWVRRTRYMLAI